MFSLPESVIIPNVYLQSKESLIIVYGDNTLSNHNSRYRKEVSDTLACRLPMTFLSVMLACKLRDMRTSTCQERDDETGSFYKHEPERAQPRREK